MTRAGKTDFARMLSDGNDTSFEQGMVGVVSEYVLIVTEAWSFFKRKHGYATQ